MADLPINDLNVESNEAADSRAAQSTTLAASSLRTHNGTGTDHRVSLAESTGVTFKFDFGEPEFGEPESPPAESSEAAGSVPEPESPAAKSTEAAGSVPEREPEALKVPTLHHKDSGSSYNTRSNETTHSERMPNSPRPKSEVYAPLSYLDPQASPETNRRIFAAFDATDPTSPTFVAENERVPGGAVAAVAGARRAEMRMRSAFFDNFGSDVDSRFVTARRSIERWIQEINEYEEILGDIIEAVNDVEKWTMVDDEEIGGDDVDVDLAQA